MATKSFQEAIQEKLAQSEFDKKLFTESVQKDPAVPVVEPEVPVIDPVIIKQNEAQALYESIAKKAVNDTRANGMSGVIAWSDGEPTADSFDLIAQGMADINEDDEVDESEEEAYNDILFAMAQALMSLGVSADNAKALATGNDEVASDVFVTVADKLESLDESDDEVIAKFAMKEEAFTEAKKRVVRDGKLVWVNVPLRKRRMSPAQKAALKKAQRKAHSSAARLTRAKSMKIANRNK